jgi:hypothetical protein
MQGTAPKSGFCLVNKPGQYCHTEDNHTPACTHNAENLCTTSWPYQQCPTARPTSNVPLPKQQTMYQVLTRTCRHLQHTQAVYRLPIPVACGLAHSLHSAPTCCAHPARCHELVGHQGLRRADLQADQALLLLLLHQMLARFACAGM